MQFLMADLPVRQRYKILVSTVTPRPIAWVTTLGENGIVNAAPYSFFNAMGDDPPLLVLGLLKDAEGADKDTATNILASGEFVVNMVAEHDMDAMNLSCVDAPRDVSEVEYAQIQTEPSVTVAPPRIASSPVSFECRLAHQVEIGPRQVVVLGEVLMAHVQDQFVSDPAKLQFDTLGMKLVGRVHGPSTYVRNSDHFDLKRGAYEPDRLQRLRKGTAHE